MPELLPYPVEKALPEAALTVMPASCSFLYTVAYTESASLSMPAVQPSDRLMTSGCRTSMSSREASSAESSSASSSLRVTFATITCAFGAVPTILSALPEAMPATCVPWEAYGVFDGDASLSPSA